MGNTLNTKELLNLYYKGFAEKKNWDSVLSEDFKFIGGDVAEIWKVKNGKLDSLTIFFDTLSFEQFTKK